MILTPSYIGLVDIREKDEIEKEQAECRRLVMYCDHTYSVDYDEIIYRPTSRISLRADWQKITCQDVSALWDTGSSQSCISRRMAEKMGLKEVDTRINIIPNGNIEAKVYRLDVVIADELIFNDLKVVEYPLERHDVDFLIGMDIISQGEFTIRNSGGKTQLLFKK